MSTSKIVIAFLFLKLIKNMLVQLFHDGGLYHKETSLLIRSANEWTTLYLIGTFTMKFFVAADKLNTFKLLNKNLISPKRIMVLYSAVNFEQF